MNDVLRGGKLERIVRKPEVLAVIGVSSATLYRWIQDGRFPAPRRLGSHSVGWLETAIRAWIESRPEVGSE